MRRLYAPIRLGKRGGRLGRARLRTCGAAHARGGGVTLLFHPKATSGRVSSARAVAEELVDCGVQAIRIAEADRVDGAGRVDKDVGGHPADVWGKETRFGLARCGVGSVPCADAAGLKLPEASRSDPTRVVGPDAGRQAMALTFVPERLAAGRAPMAWGSVASMRSTRWRQARWCSRRREHALPRPRRAAPHRTRVRTQPRLGSNGQREELVAVSFRLASLSRFGQPALLGG